MTDPVDNFPNDGGGNLDSATTSFVITPGSALSQITRAIQVNVSGTVVLQLKNDTVDRTLTMNAGQLYPYRVKSVTASGTTATGLVGLV